MGQAGWAPVMDARECGAVAYESGLVSVLFTFASSAACLAGMQIAAAWYWPVSLAPYPDGAWVWNVRPREHWWSVCTYYVASERDWKNADLYADDWGVERPQRPVIEVLGRLGPFARSAPVGPPFSMASAGAVPPKSGGAQGPMPACGSTEDAWAGYNANQRAQQPPAPTASTASSSGLVVKMPPVKQVLAAAASSQQVAKPPPKFPCKGPPAELVARWAREAVPPRKAAPKILMEQAPAKKMPTAVKPPPTNLQPPVEPKPRPRYEL